MKTGSTSIENLYTTVDGFSYGIRPIRHDDGQKLIELFNHLSPENRYLRFAHAISKLPDEYLEDILKLDYQYEMALVAFVKNAANKEEIIGVARYVSEDLESRCEFSISVSDAYSSHGVGMNLMKHLIQYARSQGLKIMLGYILSGNQKMLSMVRELGFEIKMTSHEPEFKIATLDLQK